MREYEWRTGRKCVYMNFVHLVLVTKYRKNAINNRMLNRMKDLIEETCLQMNCELLEFNGESDHIHLLVSVNPKWSVSNFVGKIKGKTSYFMRKEFWSDIKNKLWGDHFWSPSYCVVSFCTNKNCCCIFSNASNLEQFICKPDRPTVFSAFLSWPTTITLHKFFLGIEPFCH